MTKKSLVLAGVSALALSAAAKIEMGAPFADGIVLQRDRSVPVWGRATPGNAVTVRFADREMRTTADGSGKWRVDLAPLAASREGRTMTVTEAAPGWLFDDTVDVCDVKDVLVGEVWLASGQSNMDTPLWCGGTRYRDANGALLAEMTQLPLVRFYKVPSSWSAEPKSFKVAWYGMTADNLAKHRMSAVGFYYARELYLALQIPIGIVDASEGGTNIDAWTPRSGYADCDPQLRAVADYPVKATGWTKEKDGKYPICGPNQQPTVLFNGYVAAYAPMAMRGFIWYQGCHNHGESVARYSAKLHALYNGWSREFENPDLKMYFVQLAPYAIVNNWVDICMAQTKFAAEEKNAALAVTADVGNPVDIHPNQKEIVAKRLAVHALKRDYGFPIAEADSPVLASAAFKGAEARLTFSHVKNWYVYAPDRSHDPAFELAGADGVWQPAKVTNWRKNCDKNGKPFDDVYIDSPTIVLKSEKVSAPVKVRYMGQPRSYGMLFNEVSLPLGPFATK